MTKKVTTTYNIFERLNRSNIGWFITKEANEINKNVQRKEDEVILSNIEFQSKLNKIDDLRNQHKNITFKNCIFRDISLNDLYNQDSKFIKIKISFKNCEFTNININSNYLDFFILSGGKIENLRISNYKEGDLNNFPISRLTKVHIDSFDSPQEGIGFSGKTLNQIYLKNFTGDFVLIDTCEIAKILIKDSSIKEFEIQKSTISDLQIQASKFNLSFKIFNKSNIKNINSDIFDKDMKNKFYHFDIDFSSKISSTFLEQRIFFNNAKNYFLAKNDKVIANKLYVNELDSHQKNISFSLDKIILSINRKVSTYGTNWLKAISWLLGMNILLVFFYDYFFGLKFGYIATFIVMTKPLIFHFDSYFLECENKWIFLIIESLRTIFLFFFIYEFIVSLRKFKK